MKEIRKPIHQPMGVRRWSVSELILSVTEANVWPGWMTGLGVTWMSPVHSSSPPISERRTSSCG